MDRYQGPDFDDDGGEAAFAQMQIERERALCDALSEAQEKGVSLGSLQILAFETGARWKAAQ